LAAVAAAGSPDWAAAVASTPRHLLVPRWWRPSADYSRWDLVDGPADPDAWMAAAYTDATLITRVGARHADHAHGARPARGEPTSSSTLPGLVVRMLAHLRVDDGMRVIDVGAGCGYSAALLAFRLGDPAVLSVDIDGCLTAAAAQRLARFGRRPRVVSADATGPLPSEVHDRLIATVSARPVPASWLAALRPGGRLITTIAGTPLMLVAAVQADGTAAGRVLPEQATFMPTRAGPDYPPRLDHVYADARSSPGEGVRPAAAAIPDLHRDWPAAALLALVVPGVEHRSYQRSDGLRLTWLLHPDGSWARAEEGGEQAALVHQAGRLRLWDEFEAARAAWDRRGRPPLDQLRAELRPDGTGSLLWPGQPAWRLPL
jgi:protein-L-isoaspartate O-methyltransferase